MALVPRLALADTRVTHQDGLAVVLARSAAASIELQQVIIQSPLQVLPLGFHVGEVAPAENFVDGLQLCRTETKSGVWGFHLVIGPGVARMQSGSREVAG